MTAEEEPESFEFVLKGARAVIEDFRPGRDVIDLSHMGLTPWDLIPSLEGSDLVLSFDGGEVVLRGRAGLRLGQEDFRW